MNKKQRQRGEKQAHHHAQDTANHAAVLREQERADIENAKQSNPPDKAAHKNKRPSLGARFVEWTGQHSALITAVFTAVLGVVGIFQIGIYRKQLDIYTSQLEIGRNEQRGWIQATQTATRIDPKKPESWAIEGTPIKAHVVFTNTGKTPVYNFRADIAVRIVENDTPITFSYAPSSPSYTVTTGSVFPNDPVVNEIFSLEKEGVKHPLSHDEYTKLVGTRAYAVIYLQATYCDIFRVPHLLRRCAFTGMKEDATYTAKECTDYNSLDNDSVPNPSFCLSQTVPVTVTKPTAPTAHQ